MSQVVVRDDCVGRPLTGGFHKKKAMAYTNKEDQRACAAVYYAANREVMQARAVVHKRQTRAKLAAFVTALKTNKPCADCAVIYPPHILEYDHVSGVKVENIANMVHYGASMKRLVAEIAKCELVCANCHRERTHRRRQKKTQQPNPTQVHRSEERNHE